VDGVGGQESVWGALDQRAHVLEYHIAARTLRQTMGELLDVDFGAMSHMRLCRASDLLMRHRAEIEAHVFSAMQTLFSLEETITLYDLTNTYFEGEAAANPKAQHGRSKEKRTDCPLLTLGLVLDSNGFVRRSKTFAGNVSEGSTLEVMLTGLDALPGALVIMDAGIATEANLVWLVERGYRYLVVRRGGARQFEATQAVAIETAGGETLRLQKVLSKDGKEVQPPFVAVNCSALPESLMEAELFGYEKGSYTGVANAKPGLLEQTDNGTLILDEIGDMPASMQAMLLRVLQTREIRRLGGACDISVNFRLMAATHQDLRKKVE
jgi:hypothetical protein